MCVRHRGALGGFACPSKFSFGFAKPVVLGLVRLPLPQPLLFSVMMASAAASGTMVEFGDLDVV